MHIHFHILQSWYRYNFESFLLPLSNKGFNVTLLYSWVTNIVNKSHHLLELLSCSRHSTKCLYRINLKLLQQAYFQTIITISQVKIESLTSRFFSQGCTASEWQSCKSHLLCYIASFFMLTYSFVTWANATPWDNNSLHLLTTYQLS